MKQQIEEVKESDLTESTIEIDLKTMKMAERKAAANDGSASTSEEDDSDTMALFESTITNMAAFENTVTNLNLAEIEAPAKARVEAQSEDDSNEPAWRVLEKRREERELRDLTEDFLF